VEDTMSKSVPDPVDVAFDAIKEEAPSREKIAAIKGQPEFKMWEQWKQNPGPETTRPLLQHFEPIFKNKVNTWKAPNVNEAAFKAELKIRAINAFESYNPERGAALRTHLENHLMKAMRYNAQQQNTMYIPEGKSGYIGKIDAVKNELNEDLGRAPSNDEIAELLNERLKPRRPLTGAKVKQIEDSRVRDTLSSNFESDPNPFALNRDREVATLLRPTLPPDQQVVFDYLYGQNGKRQITSTNELAKELGKTPSQVSRLRTAILRKFDSYR
jgi:DNA-directed RNA polymerase specialized sigma subunit